MRRSLALIGGMLLLVLLLPATAFAGEWAQCPGVNVPVLESTITISDDNTKATAGFKVRSGCTQLPVSLVTYGKDPGTSSPRLAASSTAIFDGGDAVAQLETAGPGCNTSAYLALGKPDRSFDRLYERVLVSEGDIEGRTSCPVVGVADDDVVSGTPARTGTLPFTGADALPLMAVGATLLALGGALLVTTRRRLPARR